MIFDGVKFARQIEEELPRKKKKLVVFVDPENMAGMKYVEMKWKMAERLGVEFEIKNLNSKVETSNNIKILISKLNADPVVDGIMVQLPFPNSDELIMLIDPKKDVDGLREDSPFVPATVRAVVEILNYSFSTSPLHPSPEFRRGNEGEIVIVGNKGSVGSGLMKWIPGAIGMDKEDFDPSALLRASVIISATGQPGLITKEMVKDGFVAIDVGYPKPEFTQEALAKASFFTPVPGGVGPVTVAMLFKNLLEV